MHFKINIKTLSVVVAVLALASAARRSRIKRQNVATVETAGSTLSTTTSAPDSFKDISQIINLLGPRKQVDAVFIVSRSQSIGKRNFYEKSRYVVRELLQLYATVHANYTRVAVISYAVSHSIDHDDISGNHVPLDKCQLFSPYEDSNLPLDNLKYRKEDETGGCGIYDAFDAAAAILKTGKQRRPSATQVALLVSDVNGQCNSRETKLNVSVTPVFGMGLGAFLSEPAMKSFVSSPYASYAATVDAWMNITEKVESISRQLKPLYVESTSNVSCGQTNSTRCYCNVDDGFLKACSSEAQCSETSDNFRCASIEGQRCQRGSCLDLPYSIFCNCMEGFYGQYCQYYIDACRFPDICAKYGVCWSDPNHGGQFVCNCTAGYYGDFCQDPIPTTPTTPKPQNVTRIVTILQSVTPPPIDTTKWIILGGVLGGLAVIAIIVGVTLCVVYYIRRRKMMQQNYAKYTGSTISKDTGIQSNFAIWPSKFKRSNRFLRSGIPTVPSRFSTNLSAIDMQNVSHEEMIFTNEVLQDNRQMLKSWEVYLTEVTKKNILQAAVMANVSGKEAVATDKWSLEWSELYSLENGFGIDMEVNVQGDDYLLTASGDDFMSGEKIYDAVDGKKFLCVGRTKTYLILGILDPSQGGSEEDCRREIQYIAKHIKSEGY